MKRPRVLVLSVCLSFVVLGCRPSARATPRETVEAITQAVSAADGRALWPLLPPSFKEQLAGLVDRLGGRNPALAAVLAAAVVDASDALVGQRERLAKMQPLRDEVPTDDDRRRFAASLTDVLAASRAAHLLGQGASSREAIERGGPALLQLLVVVLRAKGSPLVTAWRPGPYRLEQLSDERVAYRRLDALDAGPELLVRVEGRWLPERWATAWRELEQRGTAWLAGGGASPLVAHRGQIELLINQTRARLRKVPAATDQETFDRALSSAGGTLSLAMIWAMTPPLAEESAPPRQALLGSPRRP
jgi:hypothetical protein